jgi:pyruvate dehydrogenase E1 component alpha subunit
VFFGDAATEEGVFHEAVNFAVLKQLPIVFICENNLYSVYSPLSVRQPPGREIWRLVRAYGLESCQGDGNDVAGVYEMAGRAVQRARSGGGPSFLELMTYRWLEHVGPDDDDKLGYRPRGELDAWKARDPLLRARSQMLAAGFSPQRLDALRGEIDAEIDAALRAAQESPFPEGQSFATHIYAP